MSGQNAGVKKHAKGKTVTKTGTALASKCADERERILARLEQVRAAQRAEGSFDCFGTAAQGYCDQGGCMYHAECMSVSALAALPFP
jgi:hypothetical protein